MFVTDPVVVVASSVVALASTDIENCVALVGIDTFRVFSVTFAAYAVIAVVSGNVTLVVATTALVRIPAVLDAALITSIVFVVAVGDSVVAVDIVVMISALGDAVVLVVMSDAVTLTAVVLVEMLLVLNGSFASVVFGDVIIPIDVVVVGVTVGVVSLSSDTISMAVLSVVGADVLATFTCPVAAVISVEMVLVFARKVMETSDGIVVNSRACKVVVASVNSIAVSFVFVVGDTVAGADVEYV